jgi:hypothetical protein
MIWAEVGEGASGVTGVTAAVGGTSESETSAAET